MTTKVTENGRSRWLILLSFVLLSTLWLIGFELWGHRSAATHSDAAMPAGAASLSASARLAPLNKETPPWKSTPENTPSAGPGFIPAWKIQPPQPTAHEWPAPVQPPNPATNSPPMYNPGGVNGARPERPRSEP